MDTVFKYNQNSTASLHNIVEYIIILSGLVKSSMTWKSDAIVFEFLTLKIFEIVGNLILELKTWIILNQFSF